MLLQECGGIFASCFPATRASGDVDSTRRELSTRGATPSSTIDQKPWLREAIQISIRGTAHVQQLNYLTSPAESCG